MQNTEVNQSNSRIAKNTIFMYLRMAFCMLISLYTSRVILETLGVEDYGLYNVVGGIIVMFAFLNNAMSNTTSRYITMYLAKKDNAKLNQLFNMSFLIHVAIALIILFLAESIGLWYLHNKLVIPEGRECAAEFLYQFSVCSAILSILYVPFNAGIIAHEKMSAFAAISIMDATLKLIIVLSLKYSPIDKLIFYGALICSISFIDFLVYFLYCKSRFIETKYKYYWNTGLFKEMMGFTSWGLIGNFSYVFYSQGINLILNLFCGPAVNAARGIAVQVETAVKQFSASVQTAINPQIFKAYATNEMQRMYLLIFASSRYCYYLLFMIILPIVIETDFILGLWLGAYPDHTVAFVRLILSITILDAFINPMFTANLASGKLMLYQIGACTVSYTFMFITYFAIKYTNVPESVFVCMLISNIVGVLTRIYILYLQIGLPPKGYVSNVFFRVISVTITAIILPMFIHMQMSEGWARFISVGLSCVLSVLFATYFVGFNSDERTFVIKKLKRFIKL